MTSDAKLLLLALAINGVSAGVVGLAASVLSWVDTPSLPRALFRFGAGFAGAFTLGLAIIAIILGDR